MDYHGGTVDSWAVRKQVRMIRGVDFPRKCGMIVEAHENGPLLFGKNKKGVNEVEGRSQKMKADNNYHRRMVVWAKSWLADDRLTLGLHCRL